MKKQIKVRKRNLKKATKGTDFQIYRKMNYLFKQGGFDKFMNHSIVMKRRTRRMVTTPKKRPRRSCRTTVLDLNDDCLLHVFQYLYVDELCSVADVCKRFRQNAQMQCVYLKPQMSYLFQSTSKQTTRIFRKFGPFIRSLQLGDVFSYGCNNEYRICEMVNRYCGERLTELEINAYNITDDVALLLGPILPRLRKLTFDNCRLSEWFIKMLPKWSPELQELTLHSVQKRFIGEQFGFFDSEPKFAKLEKVSFKYSSQIAYNDVKLFLKWNPQLKWLDFIGDYILEFIDEHAPQIASIKYEIMNEKTVDRRKLEYTSKKKGYQHLSMSAEENHTIRSDSVPPRKFNLLLRTVDWCGESDTFVNEISTLPNVTKLVIKESKNFTAAHIHAICSRLSELSEINFSGYNGKSAFSTNDLLTFIRNAKKLKVLRYDGLCRREKKKIHITHEVYMTMVYIVQQRREKIPINIILNKFTAKLWISDQLARAYKDFVTIVITNTYSFCQF